MSVESIIELVRKIVSFDTLFQWIGEKLVSEFDVKDIEVKRTSDAILLVVKAEKDRLDEIEKELRGVIRKMGFGVKKIQVVIENGQGRQDVREGGR